MVNFTDTSYLSRIFYIPLVLIWLVIRTRQTNRWEPFRLMRLELRPLFIYTFSIALLIGLAHDVILYLIKMNEGYNIKPTIVEKPKSDWTKKDLQLNNISNYLDSISISLTMTSLFMLQIFWSYVMEKMSKKNYISIFEYWIYLVLAILILPVFPVIVYLLDALVQDPKYKENIPRLSASGIALILCLVGGFRVHYRINELLNLKSRLTLKNEGKLLYFQDLNIWFSFALFIWSASYIIIGISGISSLFVTTRFISDLLIANANFGGFILYICIISIFSPNFSIKSNPRAISQPLGVTRLSNMTIGPDGQIIVETSQDIKIEPAFINPYYRPFSTTPPLTPNSSYDMNLLTPLPSPSSAFAGGLGDRNIHRSSPLQQSWKQVQSISDGSSHQTYNDRAVLTENIGRLGSDDESWQQEILNEPQTNVENYDDNVFHNNPIKRRPSQNNSLHKDMSLRDSMNSRSNSV